MRSHAASDTNELFSVDRYEKYNTGIGICLVVLCKISEVFVSFSYKKRHYNTIRDFIHLLLWQSKGI